MAINIGFDKEKGSFHIGTPEKQFNELETTELKYLISKLGVDNLEIKKKSKEYTTLTYKNSDIVRYKHTDNTWWIELAMCYISENRQELFDSKMFEAQNKMNVAMWKSIIKTSIDDYIVLIKQIITEADKFSQ